MTEWDDELEPDDLDGPAPPPAPPRRKKRRRMGATVKEMGGRARGNPASVSADQAAARRERAEQSRRLLEGGRSKGEERGFGVARSQPPGSPETP